MRPRGIAGLVAVAFLCLPSVAGAIVLLYNFAIQRPVTEWGLASTATVALAAIFGYPMLVAAIVVCAVSVLSSRVPVGVKFTDISILGLGILTTFVVTFRFRS